MIWNIIIRRLFQSSLVLLLLLCATTDGFARTAVSTAMRVGSHPGGMTRLVLDLSDSMDFTVTHQADPYRVVIASRSLQWKAGTSVGKFPGSVLSVRFEPEGTGGRLVIQLREPAMSRAAFVIPPRDGLGWRFVMDLHVTGRTQFLAAVPAPAAAKSAAKSRQAAAEQAVSALSAEPVTSVPASSAGPAGQGRDGRDDGGAGRSIIINSPMTGTSPATGTSSAANTSPGAATAVPAQAEAAAKSSGKVLASPMPPPLGKPVVQAVPQTAAPVPTQSPKMPVADPSPKALPVDGRPVIVIDPGHGGADPGAIGVSGVYEKFITLAVGRELKAELEKNGRYKVYLTRDRDIFIRLRDRVAIARQFEADLFISLHADSVANPLLRGFSVYTLSQNASDGEAQSLADKENKADLIAGVDLSHETADVANILIDLAQRETMNRSAGFAGNVVDEVGREVTLLGNSHRFAGFAVLKAPDVPSVLVEMGYLSNEGEEKQLRQPEFRTKMAQALARSIDRYFVRGQKARRQ